MSTLCTPMLGLLLGMLNSKKRALINLEKELTKLKGG